MTLTRLSDALFRRWRSVHARLRYTSPTPTAENWIADWCAANPEPPKVADGIVFMPHLHSRVVPLDDASKFEVRALSREHLRVTLIRGDGAMIAQLLDANDAQWLADALRVTAELVLKSEPYPDGTLLLRVGDDRISVEACESGSATVVSFLARGVGFALPLAKVAAVSNVLHHLLAAMATNSPYSRPLDER